MFYIAGRTQEGIGRCTICNPVILKFTDKKQDFAALFTVMDIPLACGSRIRSRALALPMEQGVIDRIVVIHRGRRIVLIRLVEGDKEHIQFLIRQPLHALTDGKPYLSILAGIYLLNSSTKAN